MNSLRIISEAAIVLASKLPVSTVEAIADVVAAGFNIKSEITKRVAHHQHRDLALSFIDTWKADASKLDGQVIAIALQTAAWSEQKHRDAQSVELVWTGPDTDANPFRRTEQAILQLLDSAQHQITLVSFAVYSIPNVANALVKAAKRGVRLTVIVETPDKLGGENEYSTIRALGAEITACSNVYYWPKEKRPLSDNNKRGILHVKCAVADGKWLFLSSANLTQQAFTINMELGMLVQGGSMPKRVEKRFHQLIQSEQLMAL